MPRSEEVDDEHVEEALGRGGVKVLCRVLVSV
jgi:hypothetical protein